MVRLDREDADAASAEPWVAPVEFTGHSTRGFLAVDAAGIVTDAELAGWVDASADHAESLPPK
jgi:hypothetical protein